MRTDLEIFEMYKEEKANVVGSLQERTGLESFATFKDWKAAYVKDYLRNHVEVSEKDADKLMDAAVEDAEAELEQLMLAEDADESQLEAAAAKVAAKKEEQATRKAEKKAKRAAKRAKTPRAKTPRAKKTVAKKAKGTGTKRTVNKAAIARGIFAEMYPKVEAGEMARKDVIAKFLEAGLTKNGASTYFQKFKAEYNAK